MYADSDRCAAVRADVLPSGRGCHIYGGVTSESLAFWVCLRPAFGQKPECEGPEGQNKTVGYTQNVSYPEFWTNASQSDLSPTLWVLGDGENSRRGGLRYDPGRRRRSAQGWSLHYRAFVAILGSIIGDCSRQLEVKRRGTPKDGIAFWPLADGRRPKCNRRIISTQFVFLGRAESVLFLVTL